MKKPNCRAAYKPDPAYLRRLIARAGHTQQSAAREIGISPRALSAYLAFDPAVYRAPPYSVQYALEGLVYGVDEARPQVRTPTLHLS